MEGPHGSPATAGATAPRGPPRTARRRGARPAVRVSCGNGARVPRLWHTLEGQREAVEIAQRGVGRTEMLGHPECDWAGTGFLVNDNGLMTTRRVCELFAEPRDGNWQ